MAVAVALLLVAGVTFWSGPLASRVKSTTALATPDFGYRRHPLLGRSCCGNKWWRGLRRPLRDRHFRAQSAGRAACREATGIGPLLAAKTAPESPPVNARSLEAVSAAKSDVGSGIVRNEDIVRMLRAGLSEQTVVLLIQGSKTDLSTTPDALIALQREGVPPRVIEAMTRRNLTIRAPNEAVMPAGPVIDRQPALPPTPAPRVLPEPPVVSLPRSEPSAASGLTFEARSHGALTREQIASAVAAGRSQPGQTQGLALMDNTKAIFQAIGEYGASRGQLTPGTQVSASGFQIVLYTPSTWVAQMASDAAAAGHLFTEQSVTEDMVRSVFRVVAAPSTPPKAGLNLGFDVSAVSEVFLVDSRKHRIPAVQSTPFLHAQLQGLMCEFPLDEVAAIRRLNQEFHVVVVGPNDRKDFTIKVKHSLGPL